MVNFLLRRLAELSHNPNPVASLPQQRRDNLRSAHVAAYRDISTKPARSIQSAITVKM
jgi:hypothetical protein